MRLTCPRLTSRALNARFRTQRSVSSLESILDSTAIDRTRARVHLTHVPSNHVQDDSDSEDDEGGYSQPQEDASEEESGDSSDSEESDSEESEEESSPSY